MTEKKILAYLNFEKNKKLDKSLMKIVFWFDFGFTAIIILFGLLLNVFKFYFLDCVYLGACIVSTVVFAIWCKKAINPTVEISFSIFVLFISTVKLFYAYLSFSNFELIEDGYPRFGWFHLTILVIFMLIVFYVWMRFYQIFCELKTHTIKQAKKNVEKKKTKLLWIPIFIGSPMILVRLIRGNMVDMSLGMGFYLWSLLCVWLCLCLMLLPKYIVIKKYKVADILGNTGDGDVF